MSRGGAGETRGLVVVNLFWSSQHIDSFSFQVLLYLLSGAAVAHNKRRLMELARAQLKTQFSSIVKRNRLIGRAKPYPC